MFSNIPYWLKCGITFGEQYSNSVSGNLSYKYMYMKMFAIALTILADQECRTS